jgi:hypothetical protein
MNLSKQAQVTNHGDAFSIAFNSGRPFSSFSANGRCAYNWGKFALLVR